MTPITYMSSLLTFYLKGEIRCDQNFIYLRRPNTILGLIPLGSRDETIAVNQIASVSTNFKVLAKKAFAGVLLAFLGLICMTASLLLGLILLLCAVNGIIYAMQTHLEIHMTSGQVNYISFLIFEKEKAELAAQQINAMIASRLSDTNTRQQTDRIVDAIHNPN